MFFTTLSTLLTVVGFYVQETCGYDCGVFGTDKDIASVFILLLGVWLFAFSLVYWLVFVFVKVRQRKRSH